MATNNLELKMYIPLTMFREHYPELPSNNENLLQDSILCSPIVSISSTKYVPSFSCNDGKDDDPITAENILSEMSIDPSNELYKAQKTLEWYYPYGLALTSCFDNSICRCDLLKSIQSFMRSVQLRNVHTDRTESNGRFSVDSYPIYLLICKDKDTYQNVCNSLSIELKGDKPYQSSNPVVAFMLADEHHNDTRAAIDLSMKIISSINGLCYKIRTKLAKALKGDSQNLHIVDHSDELFEIRSLCSIAKELCSNNVVKTNVEKQIYGEIAEAFNIKDTLLQIDNAIETIEHNDENEIRHKTEKLDTTLFITGYLGLILAVFAFMPLNFGDLLWFRVPDSYYPLRWAAFISIVFLTILICRGIYVCYKHFNNTGGGIISSKKQSKNRKKHKNATKSEKVENKKQDGKEPFIERVEKFLLKRVEFLGKLAIPIILILLVAILATVLYFCWHSMNGNPPLHL